MISTVRPRVKLRPTQIVFATGILMIAALGIVLHRVPVSDPVPAEPYIIAKFLECTAEKKNVDQCLRNLAENLLSLFPLKTILLVLGAHESDGKAFLEKCHSLAHFLGTEAYFRKKTVSSILAEATPDCLAGAFHGAVEGYFRDNEIFLKDHDDGKLKHIVNNVCARRRDFSTEWDYGNCFHGLGHALMYLTANDLLKSLAICDLLDQEKTKKLVCYDGAFMENADSLSSEIHPSRYIKQNDPYFPCTILAERYQGECYTYAMSHRFQGDTKKSFEVCAGVPAIHQSTCARLTGLHIVMDTNNPEEIIRDCAEAKNQDFRKECILGAAASLATRFGPDSDVPFVFCQAVGLGDKTGCYQAMLGGIRLRISELAKVCGKIQEEKFRNLCYAGK